MDIYFYNTLTKQKDLFKPIEEGKVKIYSCGESLLLTIFVLYQ